MRRNVTVYLAAFALLALAATPVLAGSPAVGATAPELGPLTWVFDAPDATEISQMIGEVIFIEKWGTQ